MKSKFIKFLVAILVAFVTAFLFSLPLFQSIEAQLADYWFMLRGKIKPPEQFVVIAIDERSYDQLKVPLNQAWPRKLHAELIGRLKEYGIKKIVFDVLFLDASADPQADQALAEAIAQVPTILGAEASTQQVNSGTGSYLLEDLLTPYQPFLKNAAGIGLVGLPSDEGTIRRFYTERNEQTQEVPSLAEAGLALDPSGPVPGARDLIKYYGAARTIPLYSYYQVLDQEKRLPPQALAGKTAYVGLLLRTETGPAQKDVFRAPTGGNIFGVEVHATAAANLYEKSWIRRSSPYLEGVAVATVIFLITIGLLSVTPLVGNLTIVVVIVGWLITSFLFFNQGIFIPGILPMLIVAPLLLLFSTMYYYLVVRRAEQAMRSAFELYLSPDMVRNLNSAGAASLGGEKLWATALFTDIAGFTQITEEMPAERVAQMLNDYFTEVMEVVFRNQGTLIKFIGDAVFVIWGAPLKIHNHAEMAVKTALAIDAEVRRFNASKRFPELATRIGINTGPMLVGNLGSKRRFDYTAIGDSVNLASRIEGLNKHLGTTILFSEAVRKDAGSSVTALRVGAVRVMGKKERVNLYTAFLTPIDAKMIALWEESLTLFAQREWLKAGALFVRVEQECRELAGVAQKYQSFIGQLKDTPPLPGWDGEIVFEQK